eukprot:scaffold307_cov390-Prasinococcus_capsulatus_cf.AAC.40
MPRTTLVLSASSSLADTESGDPSCRRAYPADVDFLFAHVDVDRDVASSSTCILQCLRQQICRSVRSSHPSEHYTVQQRVAAEPIAPMHAAGDCKTK